MTLVSGTDNAEWFLHSGKLGAQEIQDILKKNNLDITRFKAILDFGCGSGRVLRHMNHLRQVEVHGCDYNPLLVAWDREHLTFAHFAVNGAAEKTEYSDEKFDFIYILSVFTHISEKRQQFWIDELSRILEPGGHIFVTLHGDHWLASLSAEEKEAYDSGKMVIRQAEEEGSNTCATFHPFKYVKNVLLKEKSLEIIDFISQGALGNPSQDAYLLRKRATCSTF